VKPQRRKENLDEVVLGERGSLGKLLAKDGRAAPAQTVERGGIGPLVVMGLVIGHLGQHGPLRIRLRHFDAVTGPQALAQRRPRRLELHQRAERIEQDGLVGEAV
jgi:hypothetical protein